MIKIITFVLNIIGFAFSKPSTAALFKFFDKGICLLILSNIRIFDKIEMAIENTKAAKLYLVKAKSLSVYAIKIKVIFNNIDTLPNSPEFCNKLLSIKISH